MIRYADISGGRVDLARRAEHSPTSLHQGPGQDEMSERIDRHITATSLRLRRPVVLAPVSREDFRP